MSEKEVRSVGVIRQVKDPAPLEGSHASGEVTATAAFKDAPCLCVRHHVPVPKTAEMHHPYPQYAQKARHGKVIDDHTVALCGTAHNSVHEAIRRRLNGEEYRLGNRYQQALVDEGVRRIREG